MKPRPTARLSFPLATAVAALLATPSASALTYYWDTNGAAAFGGITGAWNGVNTFWNTDSTGATGGTFIASPTNADDLFINGGTTGTITLSGTQVASSLTFANNVAKTLSGGTSLTIGGTGTRSGIFINTGSTLDTISTPLILNATSPVVNFTNAGAFFTKLIIGTVTGSAVSGTQTINVTLSNQTYDTTFSGIIGNGGAGGVVGLTINGLGGTTAAYNTAGSVLNFNTTILSAANTYTGATNPKFSRVKVVLAP